MKRKIIVLTCVAVFVIAVGFALTSIAKAHCGWCGSAQTMSKEQTQFNGPACKCPWCTMAQAPKSGDAQPCTKKKSACSPMMQKMDMPPCMKIRCQMMMTTQIQPDDPVALLAIKDELQLSAEQSAKIEAIVAKTRKEVQAILTDQQKQKVQSLADTPGTMMQMCQKMMSKCKQKGLQGCCSMMCPWSKTAEKPTDPNS
jgi:hypothetical protein